MRPPRSACQEREDSSEEVEHEPLQIEARRRTVSLGLRAGLTRTEVATRLGLTPAAVALEGKAMGAEPAGERGVRLLEEECAALDADEMSLRLRMLSATTEVALARIYDLVLRIMKRRADLRGLDSTARRKEGTSASAELDALLNSLTQAG